MAERSQADALASEVEAHALHLLQWVVRGGHGRDPRRRLVEGLRSLDGVYGAWLGAPDESGRVVAKTVSHEPIRAYMDAVTIRVDSTRQGMGPVGRAWRSGRVEWVDDWFSDPSGSPWCDAVTALGVRSSAAIVLRGRGGTREILNLYSDREAWFSSPRWRRLIEHITSLFGVILEEFDLRRRLEQQARLDPLTRLPNRRALESHLERIQAHAARYRRPFGIALIDLDGFKSVNDTYGHEVGDQLLEHVSRCMQECIRREDFLSRQGGDEFVVVFDGLASPVDVAPLLERLRVAVATPLTLHSGARLVSGASAGVTLWNGLGEPPSVWDLLRRSDAALYRVKRARMTRQQWWRLHEAGESEAADEQAPTWQGARADRVRQGLLEQLAERACEAGDALDLARHVASVFADCDGVEGAVVVRSAPGLEPRVAATAVAASHPASRLTAPEWVALSGAIAEQGRSRPVSGRAVVSVSADAGALAGLPGTLSELLEREGSIGAVACTVAGSEADWTVLLFGVRDDLLSGVSGARCVDNACRLLSLSWRHLPDHGVAAGGNTRPPRVALGDGRLQMHFQPIIDLRTNRPVKVEALARVRENGRLMGPMDFLPRLDSDDLFGLYRAGLTQALGAVRAWADKGCVLNLAVNLPARGFVDRRYLDATAQALQQFPLPRGASLFLELLETDRVDLSDPSVVAARFAPWQSLGVRFVEDDLGAGYSSLLRLSRAPFEAVKVEQQLVRASGSAVDRPAIVRALVFIAAITHLAHVLGLRVCVEGLETAAMIEGARAVGADFGQGFGIAEPMPAARVLQWVRRHPLAPATQEESLKVELETVYRALHDSATREGVNSGDHAAAYRQLYGLYAERILRRPETDPVASEARQ